MGLLVLPGASEDFFFFSCRKKNAFVAVERCWRNTLKMVKTIELLAVCVLVINFRERQWCISVRP